MDRKEKIIYSALLVLVLLVGFIFVDNIKENKLEFKDDSFIYCGEYGYISEFLFFNSDYCKSLYNLNNGS